MLTLEEYYSYEKVSHNVKLIKKYIGENCQTKHDIWNWEMGVSEKKR